jgi:hypothetical protein
MFLLHHYTILYTTSLGVVGVVCGVAVGFTSHPGESVIVLKDFKPEVLQSCSLHEDSRRRRNDVGMSQSDLVSINHASAPTDWIWGCFMGQR